MPNPLDFHGPAFLAFYVVLGLVVTAVVAALRRRSEPATAVAGPLTDYLRIAYLRGGPDEALRIATLALMDRGLLELVDEHHVKAVHPDVPAGLQRTEQRLLESCREPARASALLADASLRVTAATECESPLVREGLLPEETMKANRVWLLMVASLLLGSVAVSKILIALSRGRTNVLFLIIAGVVFGFVVYHVTNPFRTAAGDAMLVDLRTLFWALKDRAASLSLGAMQNGNDLALVAAVFGIGSLPASAGSLEAIFRKPVSQSSSGCGSSCGSSSGSSCGSSCGGGGCGGGCGGCGS
jgi:uncharacterized protein (TIGR04222 family)